VVNALGKLNGMLVMKLQAFHCWWHQVQTKQFKVE
jgi:hypothetical protein